MKLPASAHHPWVFKRQTDVRRLSENTPECLFSLRRWKFEHWFGRTFLGGQAHCPPRTADGRYLDPRAVLAWRAWQEAVTTVTDIPPEWELSIAANSHLGYEFRWLFGIETADELARSLAHEPRLFEMAVRHEYVRLKETHERSSAHETNCRGTTNG
ncbi:hypothetical protein [Cupriavidus pinatubonensis]|uniref:hypothetical protein n=1 Tax=Cupriavidus pinatubonensis TaxID=248026 RepID=UPI0036184AF3